MFENLLFIQNSCSICFVLANANFCFYSNQNEIYRKFCMLFYVFSSKILSKNENFIHFFKSILFIHYMYNLNSFVFLRKIRKRKPKSCFSCDFNPIFLLNSFFSFIFKMYSSIGNILDNDAINLIYLFILLLFRSRFERFSWNENYVSFWSRAKK